MYIGDKKSYMSYMQMLNYMCFTLINGEEDGCFWFMSFQIRLRITAFNFNDFPRTIKTNKTN